MGVVFRQSAKNLVVVGMGAILGALVIWLSTKYTTKQERGFTGNLTIYAVTVSQLLLLGLNNMLVVYIHRFANDERKKKLLITLSLVLPALFACIFTVCYYLLRSWILNHFQPADAPFMNRYFMWLPVFTLLVLYMLLLEQYLGSQLKVAISAFMREVVLRIANIVLLLLFGFGYVDFDVLVIGSVLIYILPVSIFLFLCFKTDRFGFSFRLRDFSGAEYREIIHFSWYHFLLTISILMMSYMDAIALPLYDHNGFESVAVYTVAVFFISFLQLPAKALIPASFAILAKAFSDNDMEKVRDTFARSSVNILIPSICLGIIICCNLQNAALVIQNGYAEMIPVFLILFIGRLADIATGMNDHVLSIANYYKFNFYLSLVLMAFLFILIRILIPRYGIYGAAWSTTTTVVIFNAVKYFFVWKKLNIQPFSRNTLLILICGLPALAAGYFFPHFLDQSRHIYVRTFIDASVRSIVIIIVYALMLFWLKPSDDLVEYTASVKKNKRLF